MAENVLARILDGIATLKRGELDAVKNAVKERREVLKQQVVPPRFLSDEEKDTLAKGNSEAMIRENEKLYDYSSVAEKELPKAKQWFKAPKPAVVRDNTEYMTAYYQWRLWNADGYARYKGGVIVEKATGLSPVARDDDDDDEEEEEEEELKVWMFTRPKKEEDEEVGVAMAAVKLE